MKNLFYLACLIPFLSMSQTSFQIKYKSGDKDGIGTHPAYGYHKLTWSDFRGKQTIKEVTAVSNSGGIYQYDCLNNVCSIKAYTVFYPDSSFASTKDPYILVHEQGHFDITEIFTRRFLKYMKSWQGCSEKRAELVPVVAAQYGNMREAMQQQYDRETDRSLDHQAQERWNKWIKEELAK